MKKKLGELRTAYRKVHKDKKGTYILVNKKKIRFDKRMEIINTPVTISRNEYIGDYRAFQGVKPGKTITLAIYKK